jgi:5-dehydro-2-deoxygluconokinase
VQIRDRRSMAFEAEVTPFDLLAIGRIGVDIYPHEVGIPLEDVSSFGRYLGGSPSNVAVAAARHGLKSGIVTQVGKDPFGKFLVRELGRLGVDTRYVGVCDEFLTPVVFCEMFPPDDFPIYFYRKPSAPDMQIRAESLDLKTISNAKVFWFTVTGLSEEPSRSAHFAALAARSRKPHTIVDLDYREAFWESPIAAQEQIEKALTAVDIAIGNRGECLVAVGESDPERAADALLDRGVNLAVVKMGPRGVLAKSREERVVVSPHEVSVVNGLGAGDSFGGAFVFALSQGWGLQRVLEFANVAGAIVASRIECSTAMPTTQEVLTELAGRN